MYVIHADALRHAWPEAIDLLASEGQREDSRVGPVMVVPMPVTTVYDRPLERVMLDPVRDANPLFHFFESLWMLAGRDDARWLDQFVSGFSTRFAEDGGRMHGAYGMRWRRHFMDPGADVMDADGGRRFDQLDEVVRLLRANPRDRQAIIQMWDPSVDLGVPGLRDRPCNTQIMLRVRSVQRPTGRQLLSNPPQTEYEDISCLDMMVTCRSNDIVMGCYGANVVHFSVLQEYLAARIGVAVGRMTQVSFNWHAYDRDAAKMNHPTATRFARHSYPGHRPLVDDPELFDEELRRFLHDSDRPYDYKNSVFPRVAVPLWQANVYRRERQWRAAISAAERCHAPDWGLATMEWLDRRWSASRRT